MQIPSLFFCATQRSQIFACGFDLAVAACTHGWYNESDSIIPCAVPAREKEKAGILWSFLHCKNGSDIRGVAVETKGGQPVNLTREAVVPIAAAFARWLMQRTGKAQVRGRRARFAHFRARHCRLGAGGAWRRRPCAQTSHWPAPPPCSCAPCWARSLLTAQ